MANEMGTKTRRPSVTDKRRAFRAPHQQGCFVLPNPRDVGSAPMLQHLGFLGLASTSTGSGLPTDWQAARPVRG
jgi:2-methylisocitrate lyase-like PEP mutase family enzyme